MLRRLTAVFAAALALSVSACGGGSSVTTPGNGDPFNPDVNVTAANAAVARLNFYRAQAGVPAVTLDMDLSQGAQLHANYLKSNSVSLQVVGLSAHDESPTLQGYSTQGKQAAHNSIIYQGVTPTEAIDNWTRTFYHRLGLFDPNLIRVGFGSNGGYQVMDINRGRERGYGAPSAVTAYPGPGMTSVPTSFKEEIPMPVSDTKMGIPITVEFSGPVGQTIDDVAATITNVRTGANIVYYRNLPYDSLLQEWQYDQLIALIPKDPLPAASVIQVDISAVVDGESYSVSWQFSTK